MSRNLGLHPKPDAKKSVARRQEWYDGYPWRHQFMGLPLKPPPRGVSYFFGILFVIGVVIVALGYFFGA